MECALIRERIPRDLTLAAQRLILICYVYTSSYTADKLTTS
ncbi:protein of unknown function [Vibrio tapetis subsp. tapetis]|uniref:Uncharacterized protein n=1 Tax=Vibrio tapetis subsp. tapetis TaxID=1671868 RepID=A0A2N8ZJY1_9VIBR|nr:protein of unknown function [Vibrio tapetis subsp. tapetis]